MRRHLMTASLIAAMFIVVYVVSWYGGAKVDRWLDDQGDVSVVHEDDAGWDCATMGNRICGPTRTNGAFNVGQNVGKDRRTG